MMRISFRESVPPSLSERARKAFQLANQEAQRLNHDAIGFEHLLLGLAKEGLSPGALALRRLGFDLSWLRRQTERYHPAGSIEAVLPGALPYTTDLAHFIDEILAAAQSRGGLPLTPESLLAALIDKPGVLVDRILRQRRVSLWRLRRRLRRLAY